MFMVNPSGYCGAIRKINHTGKKYVTINPSDAMATTIREGVLILFLFI
jgi:hypothetical protein